MKLVLLCLCVLCASVVSSPAAERPNVLLILADDMGWGDARCHNAQSKIPTPHLDRLARRLKQIQNSTRTRP